MRKRDVKEFGTIEQRPRNLRRESNKPRKQWTFGGVNPAFIRVQQPKKSRRGRS